MATKVIDAAPITHFAMIPKLVEEAGLSPQAYRLYGHLKQVAGENGQCWQSQAALERDCRMSNRAVVRAKRELVDMDLIRIEVGTGGGVHQHMARGHHDAGDDTCCWCGKHPVSAHLPYPVSKAIVGRETIGVCSTCHRMYRSGHLVIDTSNCHDDAEVRLTVMVVALELFPLLGYIPVGMEYRRLTALFEWVRDNPSRFGP